MANNPTAASANKLRPIVRADFAPRGFYAAIAIDDGYGCSGCFFEPCNACGPDRPCCAQERPDKLSVIFRPDAGCQPQKAKKEEQ